MCFFVYKYIQWRSVGSATGAVALGAQFQMTGGRDYGCANGPRVGLGGGGGAQYWQPMLRH